MLRLVAHLHYQRQQSTTRVLQERPKQQRDATAKLQQTSEREEIRIDEEGDDADLSNTQLTVEENQKLDYKFRFAES